ncbi:MAG: response regulator [Patescibacteria group bacterium]|jgi:DNA-binding response OmpR family regulator
MKKRILLVEDDQYLLKIYSNKLTQNGFDVDIAITVDEAVRKFTHARPHLIFLDLILPGRNGFDFLEDLKKMQKGKKRTPVVILSNLGQDIDKKRTQDLGVADYFIKANVSLHDIVNKAKELTS